jgi:hypothetical protein
VLEARLLVKIDYRTKEQVSIPNMLTVHESGKRSDKMSNTSTRTMSKDTQELVPVPGDEADKSVELDGSSEFRVRQGMLYSRTASAKFMVGFQKKPARHLFPLILNSKWYTNFTILRRRRVE